MSVAKELQALSLRVAKATDPDERKRLIETKRKLIQAQEAARVSSVRAGIPIDLSSSTISSSSSSGAPMSAPKRNVSFKDFVPSSQLSNQVSDEAARLSAQASMREAEDAGIALLVDRQSLRDLENEAVAAESVLRKSTPLLSVSRSQSLRPLVTPPILIDSPRSPSTSMRNVLRTGSSLRSPTVIPPPVFEPLSASSLRARQANVDDLLSKPSAQSSLRGSLRSPTSASSFSGNRLSPEQTAMNRLALMDLKPKSFSAESANVSDQLVLLDSNVDNLMIAISPNTITPLQDATLTSLYNQYKETSMAVRSASKRGLPPIILENLLQSANNRALSLSQSFERFAQQNMA